MTKMILRKITEIRIGRSTKSIAISRALNTKQIKFQISNLMRIT